MVILDPAIHNRSGYAPFDSGVEQDVFIKQASGDVFIGKVWPGYTAFPSFYAANTQNWWTQTINTWRQAVPVDGLWIDMNEFLETGTLPARSCLNGACEKESGVSPSLALCLSFCLLCLDFVSRASNFCTGDCDNPTNDAAVTQLNDEYNNTHTPHNTCTASDESEPESDGLIDFSSPFFCYNSDRLVGGLRGGMGRAAWTCDVCHTHNPRHRCKCKTKGCTGRSENNTKDAAARDKKFAKKRAASPSRMQAKKLSNAKWRIESKSVYKAQLTRRRTRCREVRGDLRMRLSSRVPNQTGFCEKPGCRVPVSLCEIHHLIPARKNKHIDESIHQETSVQVLPQFKLNP